MAIPTWPVGPGLRLDCVFQGCDAPAVLHTGSGDPADDVMLCALHAVLEDRVADPERSPGGGVRLTVDTAAEETGSRRVTVSMAQDCAVGPPP